MDNYLISQYGYAGVDPFKMAPILPTTPEEAILLSNLYQVQSAVAKLAAQQAVALRHSLYNSQPTYIPSSLPLSPSSVSSSPSMSPTRADSVSPLPYQFGYAPVAPAQQTQQSFVPYEKPARVQPYRRKRRSTDTNRAGPKRVKTQSGRTQQRLTSTATSTSSSTSTSTSSPSKKTFLDLYEAYGVIGVGGGGMVYSGRRITDKLPVAIKRVMREKVKRWEKVQGHTVPQEIALMLR